MAGQSNGRAKKPNKQSPNGKLNGHLNGNLNGHLNGHADKSKTPAPTTRAHKARKTWTASLTNVVGRYVAFT